LGTVKGELMISGPGRLIEEWAACKTLPIRLCVRQKAKNPISPKEALTHERSHHRVTLFHAGIAPAEVVRGAPRMARVICGIAHEHCGFLFFSDYN
jgi:hypothetical protein